MERMSPLDALFLHVEDGVSHMHIASCAIMEGPPPAYDDFVELVRSKLPQIPATASASASFRVGWVGRCGPTIRTSASTTTSATPPCRRPVRPTTSGISWAG